MKTAVKTEKIDNILCIKDFSIIKPKSIHRTKLNLTGILKNLFIFLLIIPLLITSCGVGDSEPDLDEYDIKGMGIEEPSKIENLLALRNNSFWGPYRDELSFSDDVSMPLVNSKTDADGVLGGDERKFTAIRKKQPGENFKRKITLEPDADYELYIYFSNNSTDISVLEPLINVKIPSSVAGVQEISTSFRSQNQHLGHVYSDVVVNVASGTEVAIEPKTISFYNLDGKLQNSTQTINSIQYVKIEDLQRGVTPLCAGQGFLEPNCSGFAILKFETSKVNVEFTVMGRNYLPNTASRSEDDHQFSNYVALEKRNGKYQVELLAKMVNRSRLTVENSTIYFELVGSPNEGTTVVSAKWLKRALSQKYDVIESEAILEPWIERNDQGDPYEKFYKVDPHVELEPEQVLETYYILELSDSWVQNLCKRNEAFLKIHFNTWGTEVWGDSRFSIVPSAGVC